MAKEKEQKPKIAKVETKKKSLSTRKQEMLRRVDRRPKFSRKARRREEDEFEIRLVSIRRVSKVKKGGKRLRMSVMVVIGDKSGSIGVAIAKGKDVREAQSKAVNRAKKKLTKIQLKGQTIPHEVTKKYKAAKVFLKPAAPGTGVIAGGAVRSVVELAGIRDILSKVLGSKNTVSNVYATYKALQSLTVRRFNETK